MYRKLKILAIIFLVNSGFAVSPVFAEDCDGYMTYGALRAMPSAGSLRSYITETQGFNKSQQPDSGTCINTITLQAQKSCNSFCKNQKACPASPYVTVEYHGEVVSYKMISCEAF